jgi:glycosyl hydrolase family 16/malectin (di-glucose binding ER protein)/type IX secretion system substrate protein
MKTFILFLVFFLIISTNICAQSYRGAELRTHESFIYGRFEARYKAAAGSGVLSNFFTYHDYTSPCCEEWNEIDIEILGRYTNDIQTTTITPGQKIQNSHTKLKFSPADSFYTYAFEWTPEYVAWFVDGKEIYRQTGEHIATLVYGQKIMMNIWAAEWENWVGTWNEKQLPFFAYYDWVAYYTYNPGNGDSGTDKNFTLSWKDEFNSYDADRWGKATHTFNGNRVLFTKENIVYKDGLMILCLTNDTDLGYADKIAPDLLWARLNDNTVTARFTEKINQDDATDLGKFSITPSATITNIELLKDQRTIRLQIEEASPEQNYKLIIFGIRDIFEVPNTQAYDVVDIIRSKPLQFPLKINAGSDISYKDYLPDQPWGYEAEYGHMDGYNRKYYNSEVNGTEQDSLFLALLEEVVQYKIRVPNGIYNVQLGFAELELNEMGKREFDVWVEDTLVFYDLDLVRDFGYAQVARYNVKNVYVSDGVLDIYFNNWTSHPVINSIVVDQLATGLPDNNPNLPHKTRLGQNYPNPFNPQTTITLYLESKSFMELDVYNLLGKKVKRIFAGEKSVGQYKFNFDSQNLSSGVYFYRLNARTSKGVITEYKKMLVVK